MAKHDMPDCYYEVQTRGGGVWGTFDSYNDAFDLALKLRDEDGLFTFIYRCEIINHFAPPETEDA